MLVKKFSSALFFSIVLFLLGMGFLLVPDNVLDLIFFPIISCLIVLIGLYKLGFLDKDNKSKPEFILDLIEGIISLIVGVLFINFYSYHIMDFILALLYLAVPIIRYFYSNHKLNLFFEDLVKYYFAIIIIGSSHHFSEVLFLVLGIIHIVLALLLIGIKLFLMYKVDKKIVYEGDKNE